MKIGDLIDYRGGIWIIQELGKSRVKIFNINDFRISHVTQVTAVKRFKPVAIK